MTKLEEVARAIMAATSTHVHRPYDMTTCRIIARAAIEALRTLPPDIAEELTWYFNNDITFGQGYQVQGMWDDAIDAILNTKGE